MSHGAPVGVRIRDAVLVFNVLLSDGHEEPKWLASSTFFLA